MNIKKIRKLFKNPQKFITDSNYYQKIGTYCQEKQIVKLAFIILGNDQNLIKSTFESIELAQRNTRKNEGEIFIISEQYINTTQKFTIVNKIETAIDKINSTHIKIINQGDLVDTDYIYQLENSIKSNINSELIITSYCGIHNQKQIDPMCDAILQKKEKDLISNSRLSLLPLYSCLIFSKNIISNASNLSENLSIDCEIKNCLQLLSYFENTDYYATAKKCFTSHISNARLIEVLMETSMNVTLFEDLLFSIEDCTITESNSKIYDKTRFYIFHCIILTLMRNKKIDEALSDNEKNSIYDKILKIIQSFNPQLIRSFVSNNYNHIHKISYLNLICDPAPFNLCYIEDVDINNKQVKLKYVSQKNEIPTLLINNKPLTAKYITTKIYSILNFNCSYETYMWIDYLNANDYIGITSDIKCDFLLNGKRKNTLFINDILNAQLNKIKIREKLPFKVKVLRYLAQSKIFSRKYKKNWLFVDNDLRADDNAEHFYRYVSNYQTQESPFFILSKKSPDWKRLKSEGFNLLKFGGLKHRLALLNADFLLSSHANPAITNFLPKKHFSDLLKYKFVFLQHGITKDDQSEWLNSRNIQHLVTAAYPEFSDISSDGRYKFTSKEVILSGFPRYDTLFEKSNDSKTILIMPTWRKSLTGELIKKSSKRTKNPNFALSQFCLMWGGLLSSQHLKYLVEKNNYKIVFYPHPNLLDYLAELNIPKYIEIAEPGQKSIQQVFKETSILITDFSSVAFDIAFMNKPVLYYQFDTDSFFSEHSYSKGYFDYNCHGFGPIANNAETATEHLSKILDNGCITSTLYQKRINDFFPIRDNNNSSRLYSLLKNENHTVLDLNTIDKYIKYHCTKFNFDEIISIIQNNKKVFIKNRERLDIKTVMLLNDVSIVSAIFNHEKLANAYDFLNENFNGHLNDEIIKQSDILLINKVFNVNAAIDENIEHIELLIKKSFISNELKDLIIKFTSLLKNFGIASQYFQYNDLTNISPHLVIPEKVNYCMIRALVAKEDYQLALQRSKQIHLNSEMKELIYSWIPIDHIKSSANQFIIEALTPQIDSSKSFIEQYIDALRIKSSFDYDYYIENNILTPSVISNFIKKKYKQKKYQAIIDLHSRYEFNSDNDINCLILYSYYHVFDIDCFISQALNQSKQESLPTALSPLLVNSQLNDYDSLYSIIEKIELNYPDSLSCSFIYGISLLFHKANRPGLSKKIINLSLMVRHENHYKNNDNWRSEKDYITLLEAFNEMNKIINN